MAITFNTNITINGSAAGNLGSAYETQVRDNLLSIMMFETGRAVVRGFERTQRRLTIVPRQQQDDNASARPTNWRHATVAGARVRGGNGQHQQAWGVGTGSGSNSRIRYTPWVFATETLPRWDPVAMANWQAVLGWQPVAPGFESDEVLLHEMVHALEHVTGRMSNRPLGNNFDTLAEFHAILVVNLFQRERARPNRLNHHTYDTAPSAQIIPNAAEFWNRVETFRTRQPDLAGELARVRVQGNPFQGRAAIPQAP